LKQLAIQPFVGLGWLRFGQPRQETRRLLIDSPASFLKAASKVVDEYRDIGLHLYFDSEDKLEFIEAFAPSNPTFRGVPFLGRNAESVRSDLAALGVSCKSDEAGFDCPEVGVGATSDDEVVVGVAVYRRGYNG